MTNNLDLRDHAKPCDCRERYWEWNVGATAKMWLCERVTNHERSR